MGNKLRIGLLISGGGTTAREVIRACKNGRIPAEPVLVISSRHDAGGIQKALAEGINEKNIRVIRRKDFNSQEAFGESIISACNERGVEVIGQCGWLALTPANVIEAFVNNIFNQHPGPLDFGKPDFGGQGMFGMRVHHAVIHFARNISRPFVTEATVHRVTKEYDRGARIGIHTMEIREDDDASSLQQRLLPYEHELVVETFARYAIDGSLRELSRDGPLVMEDEMELLNQAKAQAIATYPKG